MPAASADDPLLRLPRSVYYQIVHDLRTGLPAAADGSADAADHRIHAAIAEVASMLPVNAEEASLAARCVAAHAQAMDSLRLARQCPDDTAHVMKCSAQSAAMMRAANGARALLLRVQAARHKRQADPATCDQAVWIEHCAAGLLLDALAEAAPSAPPPAPAPRTAGQPAPLTEAENYAALHPRRAALIRALGRVPDDCDFGPPEPALVRAIVTGTSPILRDLDRPPDLIPA